jgi:hypothetical protein
MSLRAVDLLGHFRENVESCISKEIARWGPGHAEHIYFSGCFVKGSEREAFLAKPYYIYRPGAEAWERQAKAVMEWQASLIPKSDKPIKKTSETRNIVRG